MELLGKKAPEFVLKDVNGHLVSLSDFLGKKVVLYFYPKDFTPGCTDQACAYRDFSKEFERLDTVVIGVSADEVTSHADFVDKYGLNAIYLSDTELVASNLYGVYREKTSFGKTKLGIVRTTFVLDEDHHIIHIFDKVVAAKDPELVIEFLEQYVVEKGK